MEVERKTKSLQTSNMKYEEEQGLRKSGSTVFCLLSGEFFLLVKTWEDICYLSHGSQTVACIRIIGKAC